MLVLMDGNVDVPSLDNSTSSAVPRVERTYEHNKRDIFAVCKFQVE